MSRSKALVISLIRANLRDPVAMLVLVILPTALSVALVYAMGNAPGVSGRAGIDFIGPETMAFNTAFVGTLGGAISIARWRENGTIRALRSAPVSKGTIMASVLGVVGGMVLLQALVIVVIGILPGINMQISSRAPLTILPVLLGTVLFYSLGVLLGRYVPTVTLVTLAATAIILPMGWVSGVLRLGVEPPWAATISTFLPLTYLRDATRWTLTDTASLLDGLAGIGVTAVAAVALFAFAIREMRWT